MNLIPIERGVLAMSIDGTIAKRNGHDVELWLKRKLNFPSLSWSYQCELFTFGTLVIDDFHAEIEDQRPGKYLVSHEHGYKVRFDAPPQPKRISFRSLSLGSITFAEFEVMPVVIPVPTHRFSSAVVIANPKLSRR